MEWDRQVLEHLGDMADYVSLHRYVGNYEDNIPDYLAVTASIDRQIEDMDAVCRYVQARRKSARRAYLCFDEWNVQYRVAVTGGHGQRAPHLAEEVYNLEDALVVAGFFNSFIRHADVVKIANLAQIVNVVGPVMTRGDELLVQSIFHPFEMMSRRRSGDALRLAVEGPSYTGRTNGTVPFVDASAILGEGVLHVFLTNRSERSAAPVSIEPTGLSIASLDSAEILTGPGPKAANSFEQPDVVAARPFEEVSVRAGRARLKLPPLSMAALTMKLG
jgi:alpha-L-arabinofuranosidase